MSVSMGSRCQARTLTPSVPLSQPAPLPSPAPPGEGEVARLGVGGSWEGGGAPLPGGGVVRVGGGSGEGTGVRAPGEAGRANRPHGGHP